MYLACARTVIFSAGALRRERVGRGFCAGLVGSAASAFFAAGWRRAGAFGFGVVEGASFVGHGVGDGVDKFGVPCRAHGDGCGEEGCRLFRPDTVEGLVPAAPHGNVEAWDAFVEVVKLRGFLF